MGAVPLGQPDGLARPVAQVVQLGPPGLAASDRPDVEHIGRVQRENPLDAFVIDDPPDRKALIDAAALAGDNRTGEYLRTFLVSLSDSAANVHDVAYLEVRNLALETFTFNCIQYFGFHWSFSYSAKLLSNVT